MGVPCYEAMKPAKQRRYQRELPRSLWARIDPMLAREQSALIWNMKARSQLTKPMKVALQNILAYVESNTSPWEAKIGFVVPRELHVDTTGDACLFAGGGYSVKLQFWFQFLWSPRVVKGTKLPTTHANFVHINALEFIVLLVELAAVIQWFRDATDEDHRRCFPEGIPYMPLVHALADNTTALGWLAKATTNSDQGQRLLGVYAALLRLEEVGINGDHLAGKLNGQADDISRPSDISLSPNVLAQQLCRTYPMLRTWQRFLPSPEFRQLLTSRLFTAPSLTPVELPQSLGRFVPAEYTISNLPLV